MRRSLATAGLVCLFVASSYVTPSAGDPVPRGGRVFQVHPGQLHGALRAATDGDTLILHRGHYRGILHDQGTPAADRSAGRAAAGDRRALPHQGHARDRGEVVRPEPSAGGGGGRGLRPGPGRDRGVDIAHGRFNQPARCATPATPSTGSTSSRPARSTSSASGRSASATPAIYLGGITTPAKAPCGSSTTTATTTTAASWWRTPSGAGSEVVGNSFNGNASRAKGEAGRRRRCSAPTGCC